MATGCLADQGTVPLAGTGDHDAAGHAEGRRGGVGRGFGLGNTGPTGPEASGYSARDGSLVREGKREGHQ
ncbi:hypothetical protein GCM10010249_43500 [Streptomyces roseolilacinus]|uniref:Uncharacterized protein n=1 Tax=Streptomyces roseolilacinus TaxID=66904 RepID=A0A918B550_9ACTN|nr:hypothetical protein GCM10010249_43500 [Streptomyces roseolilacinus]